MSLDRRTQLALWLRELAVYETGSARALTKLGHIANARPCLTRASLFIEAARFLEETGPGGVSPAPGYDEPADARSPSAGPAEHQSRRKRL